MTVYTPKPLKPSTAQGLSSRRACVVRCVLGMSFIALLARAAYLQFVQQEFLQKQGDIRYLRTLSLEASRGRIVDRNGLPLAVSSPVKSLWVNPESLPVLSMAQLRDLASLLETSPEALNRKLSAGGREFVYLKRRMDPYMADKVLTQGIPGIFAHPEFMRFYPQGEVAAQLVGLADMDGKGQEGIELAHDARLTGKAGLRQVLKDLRGQIIDDAARIVPAVNGQTVTLTIDSRIQYQAYSAIRSAVIKHRALSGSVIVLDAQNGELLATANYPSFNPNNRSKAQAESIRNRGLVDRFETGSAMKPFAMALALEDGHATPQTVLDTRSYKIGPALVQDVSPRSSLDMQGILQKSSNVGTSKLALMSAPERFWTFYRKLGFGRLAETGFPGEASGTLRDWKKWRPIDQATMSFGYGVSVSLLQLARAYTVFTNGGQLLPVSLLQQDRPPAPQRVISEQTAAAMQALLMANSLPNGGALAARVAGYSMGGKPGTARKLVDKRYVADRHRATFIGFAPGKAPRVIVAVTLDEPSSGSYYGGVVAAPVFSQVTGAALRIIGEPPDAPGQPIAALGQIKVEPDI